MRLLVLGSVCIVAASIFACGGAAEDVPATTATPAGTPQGQVEDGDLSIMVLPLDAFGAEYSFFETEDDSGFFDFAKQANCTLDPNDTAADVEALGYLKGYQLSFTDPHATNPSGDVFQIGSSADLYRDEGAAQADYEKQLQDLIRYRGKQVGTGTTLETSEVWSIPGLADQADGARMSVDYGGIRLYGAVGALRSGRLVGAVSISSVTDRDFTPEIETLLRALYERVQGVLDGTVDEEPVALPTPDGEAAASPSEPPYPDRMTLTLDDLPTGTTIDKEGYKSAAPDVYEYERDFEFGRNSDIASVFTTVRLHPDEAGAKSEMTLTRLLVTGDSSSDSPSFFAGVLASKIGGDAKDVTISELPAPAVGDESAALRVTLQTNIGAFEMTVYYVRVGRAFEALAALGTPGGVQAGDLEPLLKLFAERTATALVSAGP